MDLMEFIVGVGVGCRVLRDRDEFSDGTGVDIRYCDGRCGGGYG